MALVITLVLIAIIIAIWIFSLSQRYSEKRIDSEDQKQEKANSPFEAIKSIFKANPYPNGGQQKAVSPDTATTAEPIETVEDLENAINELYGVENTSPQSNTATSGGF